MDLMQAFSSKYEKEQPPVATVGDTVRVHIKVKEGSRERIQVFEGTVIAKKHGVEKVFPLHAPTVEKIEVVRRGKVRRAKLYYLRDRVGKSAKVKERI